MNLPAGALQGALHFPAPPGVPLDEVGEKWQSSLSEAINEITSQCLQTKLAEVTWWLWHAPMMEQTGVG